MSRDEGGSAFPQVSTSIQWSPSCERYYDDTESFGGMSLRDYLAAKAMQAVPMPQSDLHDTTAAYDRVATHAYKLADAMLRAREAA